VATTSAISSSPIAGVWKGTGVGENALSGAAVPTLIGSFLRMEYSRAVRMALTHVR
jgi:hypothetical protein